MIYKDIFNFKLLEKVEFKRNMATIEKDSVNKETLTFKLKNIKLYLKLKSLGEITLRRANQGRSRPSKTGSRSWRGSSWRAAASWSPRTCAS